MNECKAAVVALISANGKILLIKRKENKNDPWSGHIALPGGRREENEECSYTAIRECLEEVGIRPCNLIELGMYYPNNMPTMLVKAYVSCIDKEVTLQIQKEEVDTAFWADINKLEKGNGDEYYFNGYRIWGMTYRILRDIIDKKIYEKCIQPGNNTS
ncbi:NUDIX hydrolase [Sulfurisphaera ohwakuensis]|uniref:ADP-ribose pyrophosphatase YjhB (NUDIX family) n=1 Tax=Sulfurisphaera ohwakuensis TaxID=69656 RepID=A0A650CEG2_SULOH|nr:CoA pyrophosphatase [Sulfurisphaera ohwakuensis]MBB5252832.1 ADP-ribose pyrophosphatase YjhB (NUDIX family) [Sulfurisphaera ohwakuensis]QGR16231.1 NUDIX domain-containing protein [Sulfurisphaera ohwakuensis]